MCMTPDIPQPKAPVVPESVKRVASDQRRVVADNTAAATSAQSATNKTGGLAGMISGAKKSLLGV